MIEGKTITQESEVLHEVYLPFGGDKLREHFATVKGAKWTPERHVKYYRESANAYKEYLAKHPDRKGKSIEEMRGPCQIEKDEKFWAADRLVPGETAGAINWRSREFLTPTTCFRTGVSNLG